MPNQYVRAEISFHFRKEFDHPLKITLTSNVFTTVQVSELVQFTLLKMFPYSQDFQYGLANKCPE